MNARVAAIAELERRIGHTFADRALFERALTHSSVGDGSRKIEHNEQLEFLGDRVLGLLAAEWLMAHEPGVREGVLSSRFNALVNGKTCARVARRIGLPDALRLAASATKVGARDSDGVLGDACEALMAALYLDGGLETARAFFLEAWSEEFATAQPERGKDPKTRLQEWAQGRGLPIPRYMTVQRSGPDHAPVFTVSVGIEGLPSANGTGRSRQEAEKAAAQLMLEQQEKSA